MCYILKIRIICVLGLAIFVAGCLNPQIAEQERAERLYNKAVDLRGWEEFDLATTEFKEFVTKYPEHESADNAQLQIGNNYRDEGQYEDAIDAYGLVSESGDVIDWANLEIGDAYFALNNIDMASEVYESCINKYPYLNSAIAEKAQIRLDAIRKFELAKEVLKSDEVERKDNARYQIATLYFDPFGNYRMALSEFGKVYTDYPDSELADNAMWMKGRCYWELAKSKNRYHFIKQSSEQKAYVRLQQLIDNYPQLGELDRWYSEGQPHWPAGHRGDRYEKCFAEARRLLQRYPKLKEKNLTDFIDENYANAIGTWYNLLARYPNTDSATRAPKLIAEKLVELGKAYQNVGLESFAGDILRESLEIYPTAEAHIRLAYYYAEISPYTRWSVVRNYIFKHLKKAEEMVSPNSDLATEIRDLKKLMNYRIRVEALEANQFKNR